MIAALSGAGVVMASTSAATLSSTFSSIVHSYLTQEQLQGFKNDVLFFLDNPYDPTVKDMYEGLLLILPNNPNEYPTKEQEMGRPSILEVVSVDSLEWSHNPDDYFVYLPSKGSYQPAVLSTDETLKITYTTNLINPETGKARRYVVTHTAVDEVFVPVEKGERREGLKANYNSFSFGFVYNFGSSDLSEWNWRRTPFLTHYSHITEI